MSWHGLEGLRDCRHTYRHGFVFSQAVIRVFACDSCWRQYLRPECRTHATFPAVQIMYYDGQFDDARYNVALACTAAAAGGVVANYTEVKELIKVWEERGGY